MTSKQDVPAVIRTLVFDGGDTVMRVFPEFRGSMAHWPRLEAVPGIETALYALKPRCRLAIATNAADSGELLIRAALHRVGLEDYFDAVFTAREMGVRKPERPFFERVLAALACAPREAAMIGDDYQVDIAGAAAAGLRTIWFNPARSACPLLHPVHDAEVWAMADLPAIVDNLVTPARLVAISSDAREDLEAAFRDWEHHFADLLGFPDGRVPRGLDGDPFATPGREVYWLELHDRPYGFVVLDQVDLPSGGPAPGGVTQITRYGVFSDHRGRGLGSLGLPLLEAYALASGRPLIWGCLLMNPALHFWERWADDLALRGWRVERQPRESSPAARIYIVWAPRPEG